MEQRVDLFKKGMNGMKPLLELIDYRISQINGCAYCLDMHAKDARAHGETEQRLYAVSAWRETPFYTDRERAALAWAEAVNSNQVPKEVFARVKEIFSDEELIDLTLAVSNISTWNRLNLAFHPMEPGSYTVGQFG
jgi:AhpD family alkylhydroperoxidase